jgi:hypothetical protein
LDLSARRLPGGRSIIEPGRPGSAPLARQPGGGHGARTRQGQPGVVPLGQITARLPMLAVPSCRGRGLHLATQRQCGIDRCHAGEPCNRRAILPHPDRRPASWSCATLGVARHGRRIGTSPSSETHRRGGCGPSSR